MFNDLFDSIRQVNKEHEGWKNYPTWAVNLWLENDEGLYDDVKEIVQGAPR